MPVHVYVVHVQVIMEYVGGGSVSNLLRNPDSGPVGIAVRREGERGKMGGREGGQKKRKGMIM